MRTMSKKLLAVIVCFALMISTASVAMFAAGDAESNAGNQTIEATKPDSGAFTPAQAITGNNRIKKVTNLTQNPTTFEKVEFDLQIDGITGNVYDPENVSLDMTLTSSTGETLKIPGFYFVP